MRFLVVLALAIATIANARTILRPTFKGDPAILSGSEARAVFKQCSRPTPSPTGALGKPTRAEIEQFELRVQRRIAEEYEAHRPSPADITFARQYVAFTDGNVRKVYGNYYPADLTLTRRSAVVVCDGGSYFWGAVFNTKTLAVESLVLNGPG